LIIATYSAARAMDLDLLTIISLGASQWGANNPDFSWLEMETCLRQAGLNQPRLLALSWGGEDDSGLNFPTDFREKAAAAASRLNLTFIDSRNFQERVKQHLRLYEQAAGSQKIKAFINIGGSSVNLGLDSSILKLSPGLTRVEKIPGPDRRGLIQEMALLQIPVIHLLNIRRLAEIYHLPWDPQPLPQPGENILWGERTMEKKRLLFLFIVYVLVCLSWLAGLSLTQKKGDQLKP
ncbi:MAG: poly-gamma-glutamate system protein, partial [Candidatus Saccharicenans sp.]